MRRTAVLFVALLASLNYVSAQEAMWCPHAIGAAVSDHYAHRFATVTATVREALGNNRPILYLGRLDGPAVDEVAMRLRLQRYENVRDAVSDIRSGADNYVYVNSTGRKPTGMGDVDGAALRGASLELDRLGANQVFDLETQFGRHIANLLAETEPAVIVLDGLDLPPETIRAIGGPRAFGLRIGGQIGSGEAFRAYWSLLVNPNVTTTAFVNLLPASSTQASPWGFDKARSEMYAGAAVGFDTELAAAGISTLHPLTRQGAISAILEPLKEGKFVLLVGESSDDGRTLRIPSVSEVLSASDFEPLRQYRDRLLIVACNSAAISPAGSPLSIVGTIYSHDATKFVRATLARAPATAEEYFDIPATSASPARAVSNAITRIGTQHAPVRVQGGIYRISTSSGVVAPRQSVAAPGAPTDVSQIEPTDRLLLAPKEPLFLLLIGAIGGLTRELLRWRRLIQRKRAVRYLTATYFSITAVLLLCSGGAGVVFGGLFSIPVSRVVAFVAGAGLEKLVDLAAQLKIWAPNVPMGTGDSSESSIEATAIEFLRT